jgi:translation elongation factor EF-1beta
LIHFSVSQTQIVLDSNSFFHQNPRISDVKGTTKKAEKAVEKSLVVLEVKPWEADTDLEMVWREIIKFQKEGLVWGETFKLEPVAYGIKKLVMTCAIVDSLIVMDDVTDAIEAIDQYVQSVQVASMNKI